MKLKALACILGLVPLLHVNAEELPVRNPANLSLRNEVGMAIQKGLSYLKTQQKPDGSWSREEETYAALTAFPLIAFQNDPKGEYRKNAPEFIKKGYDFLRSQAKPDGGIYHDELECVNTSLAMMALLGPNDPQDATLLAKANEFLVKMQNRDSAFPPFDGGFSYGPDIEMRQWGDMHNTVCALEALRAYESQDKSDGKKLNWDAAIQFASKCQNLSSHNNQPWVSDDAANKGGFVYSPMASTAGDQEMAGRRKGLRSYGSMTYAGILCLVYSKADAEDPRIKAALDWTAQNFSVEENPNLGKQGLFLYYNLMANALATANVDQLSLPDGRKIDWAKELAVKLISMQKVDGTWVNENSRWMENDPMLVTAYTVIALEMIYRRL